MDNRNYINILEKENVELVEALEHCMKIFYSMANRGRYPLECLPSEKEFLGKQGLLFAVIPLRKHHTRKESRNK